MPVSEDGVFVDAKMSRVVAGIALPIPTLPSDVMRSLSVFDEPFSTMKLFPLSPCILALFVYPFAQVN